MRGTCEPPPLGDRLRWVRIVVPNELHVLDGDLAVVLVRKPPSAASDIRTKFLEGFRSIAAMPHQSARAKSTYIGANTAGAFGTLALPAKALADGMPA